VYLEPGYYANKGIYADILRLNSYVTDEGECNPDALAQSLTLASFTAGDLNLMCKPRPRRASTRR
jgi:hypothetical protein